MRIDMTAMPVAAPAASVAPVPHRWGGAEWLCCGWIVLALASLVPVTLLLQGQFPLFTTIWLGVPLIAVLVTRDARRVGFRAVPRAEYLRVTAINAGLLALLAAPLELWSHTTRQMMTVTLAAEPPDTTFAWLIRYDGPGAWLAFLLYGGLVTLFAEELFFRGWLLQFARPRMHPVAAIALQACLFALLNSIVALFLPPLPGLLYAVIFAGVGVGGIGGWAAWRTGSIWPGLTVAAILNVLLVLQPI